MPKRLADKPVRYQLCVMHDGEHKERFCFDHGMTVCGVCSQRKHKECEVWSVTEAHKRFDFSVERKAFCNDIEFLINYANTVRKSVEDNIIKLDANSKSILKETEAYCDRMINQIKESYQGFSTDVRKKVKEQKEVLSSSELAVDRIISELIATLQSLQPTDTKKENDLKQFLDLQSHAETVRICQHKMKSLDISLVGIEYNLKKAIQPLVDLLSIFGEVSVQFKPFCCETMFPNIKYPYTRPAKIETAQLHCQ